MLGHVQQRRVFRGRGGPNDRRLPKHNARRRRPPPQLREESLNSIQQPAASGEEDESDWSSIEGDDADNDEPMIDGEQVGVVNKKDESLEPSEEDSHFQNEVGHFQQRIRNIKYSMQTSTLALNTPSTYQKNALRAILNCATEWKSVLKFHNERIQEALDCSEAQTIATCKACGLSLFELIQLGLQCGPLAGSKPGYFKRCGSEIATMVHDFLQELAPDRDELVGMFCSEKQADAIEKWKKDASKAITQDAEPSKHVQKKIHEAAKKRAKN